MNLYLLDLDRTAFKTDEHFADFCDVLKTDFDIDADILKQHEHQLQEKPSPYSPIDDLRYSQLVDVDEDKVKQVATSKLSSNGKSYLYEDVSSFIERIKQNGDKLVLVTVGTHEYQQHKISLCPELRDIPVLITKDPKSKLLGEVMDFSNTDTVIFRHENSKLEVDFVYLIDDRAGTFDAQMPKDNRFMPIRIIRNDAAYSNQPTPPGISQVDSLDKITVK